MLTESVRQEIPKDTRHYILFGIESHVCILQTFLDLQSTATSPLVWVVEDAMRSQRDSDMSAAIKRMRQAGAIVTTAESVVFEAMRTAEHPRFRAISALFKS